MTDAKHVGMHYDIFCILYPYDTRLHMVCLVTEEIFLMYLLTSDGVD